MKYHQEKTTDGARGAADTSSHQKARQIVSRLVLYIFCSLNVQNCPIRGLLTIDSYLTNRPLPKTI